MAGYDDDEWVDGVPPEGRHTRDQAKPSFWWRTRPARLGFAGILVALLVLVLVVVLAGCGGGGGGSDTADRPRATARPADILRDAEAALRAIHAYHVTGTSVDKDGRHRISGDVTDSGALRFTVVDHVSRFSVIVAGGGTYLKAGRAFWRKGNGVHGRVMARVFADRWVKMPAAAAASLQRDVHQLLPKELAHCVSRGLGTLENLGARTAHGTPVVVIRDRGDRPGTSPGELTVAATGTALPLLVRQTGPRRPGGHPDARCQDEGDTTTRSESILSRFDQVAPIHAPKGALDLGALGGGTGGGTPA